MRRFQIIMTTRVQSLLATLDGRGGHIKPFIPSFHTNSPPPFLFYHPFAYFTTICIPSLGKLTLRRSCYSNSLTVYFTELVAMGGSVIRNEPCHDSPVRTLSSSLSNFSAGRMAQLFSETPGV
jgi:hypothetical protein